MAPEPENHISLVGPKPGACIELAPRTEAQSNTIALSQPLSENFKEVIAAERYSATSKLSHHPTTENSARAKVLLKTTCCMCPETASSEISVLGGTDAPRLAIPTLHLPDQSDSTPTPRADLWHTTHSTGTNLPHSQTKNTIKLRWENVQNPVPQTKVSSQTNFDPLTNQNKNHLTLGGSPRTIPHQAPRSYGPSTTSIPRHYTSAQSHNATLQRTLYAPDQ